MSDLLDTISRNDLEALKANWMADPCWDIEKTDGFEDFTEELLQFRLQKEAEWAAERITHLQEESVRLGMPGDHAAAQAHEILQWHHHEADVMLWRWDGHGHGMNGRDGLFGVLEKLKVLCAAQSDNILRLEKKIYSLEQKLNDLDDEVLESKAAHREA